MELRNTCQSDGFGSKAAKYEGMARCTRFVPSQSESSLIKTRLNPRGRSPRRAARGGSTGADIFVKFLSKPTCCLPSTKPTFVVVMSFLQDKRRATFVQKRQNLCQTGARKLLRFFSKNHVFWGPPTSLMLLQIEAAPEHLQIHQYLTFFFRCWFVFQQFFVTAAS